MRTIQWGIIGVGDVTEVKSGPALYKAPHSSVVAVMRRTAHLAEDYARRHNIPRWYDDADALIADPEVHAVYIATPPDTHMLYTLKAAAAGKPVYVEKPMARTFAECQRMIAACEQADVDLFVAYYRRKLPRFEKARELVQSGALGDVRTVQLTITQTALAVAPGEPLPWRVVPEVAGGGLFLDLASHMLDWADHVFGPITAAHGIAANHAGLYPAEDVVTGTWQHESGVQGVGVWNFAADRRTDLIEIVGSRGRLRFPCFAPEPLALTTADGTTTFDIPNPPHIQQPLVETIVAALNGTGTCPSTGVTAARTSRVMDAMLAAWRAEHGPDFAALER
ncbi:MAG: Gfo/Idh/MocA family oxidoreductase [Anaerolineae bacterium]